MTLEALSNDAVDVIAKRKWHLNDALEKQIALSPVERDALCQTVRALRQALRDHGEHESHCKSNERYPSPKCDCVLAPYLDHQGD